MNKTAIEWTDFTWNPITGCLKGCSYCYAHRMAQSRLRRLYLANHNVAPGCDPADPFSPRFWPERLEEPGGLKQPAKIFAVDMGELFGPWLPVQWILKVLSTIEENEQHTFQLLTKQPWVAACFKFSGNAWVGTTIENDGPQMALRRYSLAQIKAPVLFISYEPLLGYVKWVPYWADWIIIGAMTGKGAIAPRQEWVQRLIDCADAQGIPVFLKDNLGWSVQRREYPSIQMLK